MSKRILALLMAAGALVLFAAPAMALTAAHQAAATGATQGDCSGCHIPHKAQGAQRLFPLEPGAGSIASWGYMGAMCAEYCHANGAVPLANAINTALFSPGASTAANPGTHGMTIARLPENNALPNTLPYLTGGGVKDSLGGNTVFECTTCHNPHKNATGDLSEALLQVDIDGICQVCHTSRGTGDTGWVAGGNGYGDTNALSSHPVGSDVYDDESLSDLDGDGAVDDANSPIFIGGAGGAGTTVFDQAYGASAGHNLGGHLLNGVAKGAGGAAVTCQTCHAVHGNCPDADADYNPDDGSPFEDLLAADQGQDAIAAAETGDGFAGNGNAELNNALCEGCHMNQALAAWTWDPGATLYSHPCDQSGSVANMGVVADPSGGAWPYGSTAGAQMDLAVICETCHDAHGAAANSHILRADELAICGMCHTTTPIGHHPVGAGIMAACGFSDPDIGDNDADLECSDCHNGQGAHNWTAAGAIGLDPEWEPFEHGRIASADCPTAEPADGAVKIQNCSPSISKECYDCHNAGSYAAANFSPTCNNNNENGTLENRGEGSHFLGVSTVDITAGLLGGAAFNPYSGDWNGGAGVAQSRWNGTATTVNNYQTVCDSCHELEFDRKNNANNALLLYDYIEEKDEADSELCQGCHGATPGGGGTHPLTGDTVSKAVDAGRGTTTVITGVGSYANAAGAPNSAEYPATADRVNCDSCHQVHDSEDVGGTFILEFGAGVGTGLADCTFSGTAIAVDAASGQGIDHNVLCTQCHGY